VSHTYVETVFLPLWVALGWFSKLGSRLGFLISDWSIFLSSPAAVQFPLCFFNSFKKPLNSVLFERRHGKSETTSRLLVLAYSFGVCLYLEHISGDIILYGRALLRIYDAELWKVVKLSQIFNGPLLFLSNQLLTLTIQPRPIQPNHFRANLIWWYGPFKHYWEGL
jgi:hypothetical protein